MFSFICALKNGSVNNRDAGDLRHRGAHNDVIVMQMNLRCGQQFRDQQCQIWLLKYVQRCTVYFGYTNGFCGFVWFIYFLLRWVLLICDRPTSTWLLQMHWRQTGARPSASTRLTLWWQRCTDITLLPLNKPFERGQEFGDPLVSLAGWLFHTNYVLSVRQITKSSSTFFCY